MNAKHGPKAGTVPWRSQFGDLRCSSLPRSNIQQLFTVPHFSYSATPCYVPIQWDRNVIDTKSTAKADPCNKAKNYNCVYFKQPAYPKQIGTEEARTCEAWFQLTFRPQKWNLKAHMWYQLSPFPSSNVAICDAAPPRQHAPILRYSALLRYSVLCFNSITQCNWHDIETMAE